MEAHASPFPCKITFEHLDGHNAIKKYLPALVNNPHTAGTDDRDQLVLAYISGAKQLIVTRIGLRRRQIAGGGLSGTGIDAFSRAHAMTLHHRWRQVYRSYFKLPQVAYCRLRAVYFV